MQMQQKWSSSCPKKDGQQVLITTNPSHEIFPEVFEQSLIQSNMECRVVMLKVYLHPEMGVRVN